MLNDELLLHLIETNFILYAEINGPMGFIDEQFVDYGEFR